MRRRRNERREEKRRVLNRTQDKSKGERREGDELGERVGGGEDRSRQQEHWKLEMANSGSGGDRDSTPQIDGRERMKSACGGLT